MEYFLALDAGDSTTECWLADREQVLARRSGETIKLMEVGVPEASARLRTLVEETARVGGVPLFSIARSCLGLAGISSAGIRTWAEVTYTDFVSGELILVGDDEIALQSAFGDGPGILVIAGTGSRVVGRCSNGSRMTAGGWGPMLGDEGSGHWIGLEAVRSGLRARDRGVPSCLLREISAHWRLDNVDALLVKANHRPRPEFSKLVPLVSECASKGDVLANSVLERAGEELAAQVNLVVSKMMAAGCPASDMRRVAFTGGVLGNTPVVHGKLQAALKRLQPALEIDAEPIRPIEGALARARSGKGQWGRSGPRNGDG